MTREERERFRNSLTRRADMRMARQALKVLDELDAAEARADALRAERDRLAEVLERVERAADRHDLEATQFDSIDEPDPDRPGHTFHEESIKWHETVAKALRAALAGEEPKP